MLNPKVFLRNAEKALDRQLLENGRDGLIKNMYAVFNASSRKWIFQMLMFDNLILNQDYWLFDKKICQIFQDWFIESCRARSLDDMGEDKYENFKALMSSSDFMLLCFCLYKNYSYDSLLEMDDTNMEDQSFKRFDDKVISLRSSDKVVYKMDKTAATTQSEVLKGLIDCTGGRDEVPVPIVSGGILSKVIDFCEKQHDLHKMFKSVADRYKGWVTGFVNSNRAILSDLYQAADFLNIPSLLDLTLQSVGGIMGRTLDDISEWYSKLSISRMLSPLGVWAELHDQGGTPWPHG